MIVLTRFRVPVPAAADFLDDAQVALDALAAQPGFEGGELGRATDDPALWAMSTRWAGVGAYRRALSAYEVKLRAVPLLSRAVDEAGAYEVLARPGGPGAPGGRTARAADAGSVGVGQASAPRVATDLDRGGGPSGVAWSLADTQPDGDRPRGQQ